MKNKHQVDLATQEFQNEVSLHCVVYKTKQNGLIIIIDSLKLRFEMSLFYLITALSELFFHIQTF